MTRRAASRPLAALAAVGISLSFAVSSRAQDPQVPADTLAPDSLAIPPDPFLADTLDAEILPDSLLALPGAAPASGGFPWLVELPGWHGFSIDHYNRVDGLTPSWGLELDAVEPAVHPSLAGRVALATTHSEPYWSASVRQRLPLPGAFHAHAEYFKRSTTFDDWKITIRENDVSTFVFASDLLDWWLEKGYAAGIDAETPGGRLSGGVTYLDASQRAQNDRSPFALLGSNYRDNPPADEGDLHSLTAWLQVDTRDIQSPLLPSPGWWLRAEVETAGGLLGGELSFRRAALDARRFTRIGEDAWWDTRVVWMGPLDGDSLPAQRHVMLGGPGSLRGFRSGSFVDSQGIQASSMIRLPLPVGRRIALLFLSWHWVACADLGALGDYEEWHADVGSGISGLNLLSHVELLIAQRVTDLDEEGSGPRFVVRLRRDL
jgi:hypothetical protein